jgi:putative hemolysin
MAESIGIRALKDSARLVVKQASSTAEIEAAMRLRFEVFNIELNEGLQSSYQDGLDRDEYDAHCDHIIVVDERTAGVVGTYRLLPGARAENSIGYYSETEFNLEAFRNLEAEKLEIGRACIHRDYRKSTVLGLMWSGIARYLKEHSARYLFGCASIHTINPHIVSSIYTYLKTRYLADERLRVTPVKTVPGFTREYPFYDPLMSRYIPNLSKASLKIGARIAGEPAYDEQFGVSDFLIVLDSRKILANYQRRYCS